MSLSFINNLPKKEKISILVILLLIIAIPVSLYLVKQTQVFKPRASALTCTSDQSGQPVSQTCVDNVKFLVYEYAEGEQCKLFYEAVTGSCTDSSPTPPVSPTASGTPSPSPSGTGSPTPGPSGFRPGDLNQDGRVDIRDFSILLSKWRTSDAVADINDDGKVDIRDYSILFSNWTRQSS